MAPTEFRRCGKNLDEITKGVRDFNEGMSLLLKSIYEFGYPSHDDGRHLRTRRTDSGWWESEWDTFVGNGRNLQNQAKNFDDLLSPVLAGNATRNLQTDGNIFDELSPILPGVSLISDLFTINGFFEQDISNTELLEQLLAALTAHTKLLEATIKAGHAGKDIEDSLSDLLKLEHKARAYLYPNLAPNARQVHKDTFLEECRANPPSFIFEQCYRHVCEDCGYVMPGDYFHDFQVHAAQKFPDNLLEQGWLVRQKFLFPTFLCMAKAITLHEICVIHADEDGCPSGEDRVWQDRRKKMPEQFFEAVVHVRNVEHKLYIQPHHQPEDDWVCDTDRCEDDEGQSQYFHKRCNAWIDCQCQDGQKLPCEERSWQCKKLYPGLQCNRIPS